MPFKSDAQRKFLYKNEPEVAREFAAEERKGSYKRASGSKKEAIRRALMKKAKKKD